MDMSSQDTGLTCLTMVARFHQVAADAAQLQHQFGREDQSFDELA